METQFDYYTCDLLFDVKTEKEFWLKYDLQKIELSIMEDFIREHGLKKGE